MKRTLEGAHEYWRHPGAENDPRRYLGRGRYERSRYLLSWVRGMGLPEDASILEIGCNAGRNLWVLWEAGYRNLTGIEINEGAVQVMRQRFPKMGGDVRVGAVEEILLQELGNFDLIFTMAVLVHIHPDSDWILAEMAHKGRNIITFEDEHTNKSRHYARNYQKVFEGLGMEQVQYVHPVPGMSRAYTGRAFQRSIK